MKLLHLVPKPVYDTKMSRVRFEEVAELPTANPPMQVHTTGPGWPDWPRDVEPDAFVRSVLDYYKNDPEERPQVILSYGVNGLGALPIPTVQIFHETYNFPKTLQQIRDVGTKLVIFTYANDLALYAPVLAAENRLLYSIPHGATQKLYSTDLIDQQWRDIDVLVVGNLAEQFYPFRHRLARLAWRELAKRGYHVHQAPHPGFTSTQAVQHVSDRDTKLPCKFPGCKGQEPVSGVGYAALLRRSKLVVTCCSRQKYAFAKLVEIPLCGAVPLSDLPWERQPFFRQTMLNVEPWMTDREILYRVEEVLDTPDLWQRLAQRAHDKVASRLEMRHWAERFVYVVRRMLLGEDPAPPTPVMGDDDTSGDP